MKNYSIFHQKCGMDTTASGRVVAFAAKDTAISSSRNPHPSLARARSSAGMSTVSVLSIGSNQYLVPVINTKRLHILKTAGLISPAEAYFNIKSTLSLLTNYERLADNVYAIIHKHIYQAA